MWSCVFNERQRGIFLMDNCYIINDRRNPTNTFKLKDARDRAAAFLPRL